MSWLTDDPAVLDFVLDAVVTWDGSDVDTTSSSDEFSDTTHATEPTATSSPVSEGIPKKRRSRSNRREEILGLRAQAATLTETLETLELQCRAKPQFQNALVKWEQQARRELNTRRRAEATNAWLRTTLARHVKTTRRLVQLVNEIQKMSSEPSALDGEIYLNRLPHHGHGDDAPRQLAVEIHEGSPTDAVVIEITDAWSFASHTKASIEAALWTLFSADHMRVTQFAVDFEIVASDPSSVDSSFTIHSQDGFQFRGVQSARCVRDERTGDFVVSTTAQTHPLGVHDGDSLADATLLEEETQFRVSGTATTCAVSVERRFRLHAKGPRRLEIAQAVADHVKEEMQWMQDEVERRTTQLGEKKESECCSPKREAVKTERSTEPELTYVL